jgi:LacI family transcriptional regulator
LGILGRKEWGKNVTVDENACFRISYLPVDITDSIPMSTTIDDIARETGYHRTTVSKVLAGDKRCYASVKTCSIIQDTARRMNFVPNYFARTLQAKRSLTVGVTGRLDSTGVTGPTLKAIVDGLRAREYMALFCDCSSRGEDARRVLRQFQERRVDGIILDTELDDLTLLELLPEGTPAVAIRSVSTSNFPSVLADRRQAFENGVQWLAERGHRRIAFMGVNNAAAMLIPYNTHTLKIKGYCSAMEQLGLLDATLLLSAPFHPGATRTFVAGQADLFKSLTAVLACNDQVAVEVMSGLADLGLRVPKDCAVIGFDDTEFAMAVRPRLTTFQPRRAEVGAQAVRMLLDLIEGKEVENVTLVPELIERESAGTCGQK